ncbi:hypothetical protein BaRGS_00019274, partial [Batillaria attramentaria]
PRTVDPKGSEVARTGTLATTQVTWISFAVPARQGNRRETVKGSAGVVSDSQPVLQCYGWQCSPKLDKTTLAQRDGAHSERGRGDSEVEMSSVWHTGNVIYYNACDKVKEAGVGSRLNVPSAKWLAKHANRFKDKMQTLVFVILLLTHDMSAKGEFLPITLNINIPVRDAGNGSGGPVEVVSRSWARVKTAVADLRRTSSRNAHQCQFLPKVVSFKERTITMRTVKFLSLLFPLKKFISRPQNKAKQIIISDDLQSLLYKASQNGPKRISRVLLNFDTITLVTVCSIPTLSNKKQTNENSERVVLLAAF